MPLAGRTANASLFERVLRKSGFYCCHINEATTLRKKPLSPLRRRGGTHCSPIRATGPSNTTRTIKTEVVLKDNEVLVMGGLMRTTVTETIEGISWLKDIPYLGWLFSTQENSTKKRELMLFITPHIISNVSDSNFITDQFKKKLRNLKEKLQSISKAEAIATPDSGPTPSNSTLTETR